MAPRGPLGRGFLFRVCLDTSVPVLLVAVLSFLRLPLLCIIIIIITVVTIIITIIIIIIITVVTIIIIIIITIVSSITIVINITTSQEVSWASSAWASSARASSAGRVQPGEFFGAMPGEFLQPHESEPAVRPWQGWLGEFSRASSVRAS